ASHFAPGEMMRALDVYRRTFRPSDQLAEPYAMLGLNVFAADTDEEARTLCTSLQQAFVNLRSGRAGKLPRPVPPTGRAARLGGAEPAMLGVDLSCSVVGDADAVREGLKALVARTGADELMITGRIHDHAARLRSFDLAAAAHASL